MKKLTGIFLVLLLVLSLLPLGVLAQEGEEALDSAEQSDILLPEGDTNEPEETNEPTEEVTEEPTETTEESSELTVENVEDEVVAVSELPLDGAVFTSGACGAEGYNLIWTLEDTTLTISGSGAMADYKGYASTPWWQFTTGQIKSVVIEPGVTSIGDYAFNNCYELSSVLIPDGVSSIGYGAFKNCWNLESVTIPKDVVLIRSNAFEGCSSLTNITVDTWNQAYCDVDGVLFDKEMTKILLYPKAKTAVCYTIPSGVKYIGSWAFSGRPVSLVIPTSVTIIDTDNFSYSSVYVYYAGTEEEWANVRGADALSIKKIYYSSAGPEDGIIDSGPCGDSLTWTFGENGILTISGIGPMDDYDCTDESKVPPWHILRRVISSIMMEHGVSSVGNDAFSDCPLLTSVNIPGSVTSIGDNAFYGCDKLTGVTIPNGVTSIGEWAFYWCVGLTNIVIPSSVKSIGDCAFYQCYSLANVTIRNGVTSIGDFAFSECSLTSIAIPESVTSCGSGAFSWVPLTSVTLGSGMESIGEGLFSFCVTLASVTIPNSIRSIGECAFWNCNALKDVYYAGTAENWGDIGVGRDNECLTNATIHYSSTTVVNGDSNNDGKVDGRDLIRLCSYLANYDSAAGESTTQIYGGADVNGDGVVDGRDLVRLCRYLANYDSTTGSSTIKLGPTN